MKIRQSIAWIAATLLLILGAAGAEEPTILEDPEGGRWEYHSENLNIVIERFTEKVKSGSKKKRGSTAWRIFRPRRRARCIRS